jgi:hypothetical protein
MRLSNWSNLHFQRITQHLRSSQTLAAVGDQHWWLAVAPPGALRPEDIVAFEVSPPDALSLHVGTWHSGPYFHEPERDFYNLELSDTYVIDHDTKDYRPGEVRISGGVLRSDCVTSLKLLALPSPRWRPGKRRLCSRSCRLRCSDEMMSR